MDRDERGEGYAIGFDVSTYPGTKTCVNDLQVLICLGYIF